MRSNPTVNHVPTTAARNGSAAAPGSGNEPEEMGRGQSVSNRISLFINMFILPELCVHNRFVRCTHTRRSAQAISRRNMAVRVDGNFDGGSIEVISAEDPRDIQLELKADPPCAIEGMKQFRQHFCFRVLGVGLLE